MADLNTLLHWAIENTPQPGTAAEGAAAPSAPSAPSDPAGMQLTFKPAAPGAQPSQSTLATFHPDDPQHDVGLAPPSAPPAADAHKPLTSEMLDLIMGKPDSITMKEKMAIASNTAADVDERVMALDDFEMLIEMIDNANNMPVLKLWEPLLALVNDPVDEVARHALWVAGTAIQNNLKGQAAVRPTSTMSRRLIPVLHLRRPPSGPRQDLPPFRHYAGGNTRQGSLRAIGCAQALASGRRCPLLRPWARVLRPPRRRRRRRPGH